MHVAATGAEALEVAGRYPPDLVILDLGLPDLDGVEVIQGLRGWTRAPIIVLSGRVASGHFAAAVTGTVLFLPYLAIGAGCVAVALYATRIPRGTL